MANQIHWKRKENRRSWGRFGKVDIRKIQPLKVKSIDCQWKVIEIHQQTSQRLLTFNWKDDLKDEFKQGHFAVENWCVEKRELTPQKRQRLYRTSK